MRFVVCVNVWLVVFFGLAQRVAYADSDPWVVLQKTAIAARALNYQGLFVYQNGSQLRSVQITHMNDGINEFTRNMVMEGEPREVYSHGKDIVILQPKNDKVVMEKRHGQNLFPAILPSNLDLIKTSYKAHFGPNEIISGRSAQVINLESKDDYRYSYKLWTDNENSLLLKMVLLNKNETVEQVEFNQINFHQNQQSNVVQPKIDASKNYVVDDISKTNHVNGGNWSVTDLPPGYRKIDQIELKVPGKTVIVNQLIYSDGLAAVSLFIEPVSKGVRPKTGHTVMGSTNICANVIDGHQIIVIGEVPARTVMQISKAVRFDK